MKMKNKRGFTLVELLAVIVVLAILILIAMPQVLRMMQSAQRSAFILEAHTIMKQAETAYTEESLQHGMKPQCYTIRELKDKGYLKKSFKDSYLGYIQVNPNSQSAGNYTFTVTLYLTNGSYYINGKTEEQFSETDGVATSGTINENACVKNP